MNKIVFGFRNVHIAFYDEETGTWGKPIRIPGAISWSPTPTGESSEFYADDMIYFMTNANTGYDASLEVAAFTDEIKARMLGWIIDDNGMLVEWADGTPEKFALMGEVQGDAKNRRFVYYDVQANRPSKEERTKEETIEPNPDVMPVKVLPITVDDRMIIKGDLQLNDTNKTIYDAFFDEVYTPVITSTP